MADYDFRTPLHLAAEEMHAPCVELLLASRADVNAADRWGSTPLAGVEALIAVGEDSAGGAAQGTWTRGRFGGGRLGAAQRRERGSSGACGRSRARMWKNVGARAGAEPAESPANVRQGVGPDSAKAGPESEPISARFRPHLGHSEKGNDSGTLIEQLPHEVG